MRGGRKQIEKEWRGAQQSKNFPFVCQKGFEGKFEREFEEGEGSEREREGRGKECGNWKTKGRDRVCLQG